MLKTFVWVLVALAALYVGARWVYENAPWEAEREWHGRGKPTPEKPWKAMIGDQPLEIIAIDGNFITFRGGQKLTVKPCPDGSALMWQEKGGHKSNVRCSPRLAK